jgi:hypothetical protein
MSLEKDINKQINIIIKKRKEKRTNAFSRSIHDMRLLGKATKERKNSYFRFFLFLIDRPILSPSSQMHFLLIPIARALHAKSSGSLSFNW